MENDLPDDKTTPQKKNLLTNPTLMGWLTIIGLPLGLYSLYLTFAFNKEARPTFKILSDVVITGSQSNAKIKVIYDSVQVQNVRTVTITLWNAGNGFLSKEAFSKDKPITIKCSKPVGILDISALAVSRPDLEFIATYHIDDVAGTPVDTTSTNSDFVTLEIRGDEGFEAGDGATLSILYTTNAVDYQWYVDSRIKGIPKGFTKAIGGKFISESVVHLFTGIALLIFLFYGSGGLTPVKKKWPWLIPGLLILGYIVFVIYAMNTLYPNSLEPPQALTK